MELIVLGTGDALGSGGRNQPAFLLQGGTWTVLLDCGASTLPALRKANVDPRDIRLILLSHLHGDHIAGVPFLILEFQIASRRDTPLVIAGPPGTEEKIEGLFRLMYTETAELMERRFEIQYVELEEGCPTQLGPVEVLARKVAHQHREIPYGYRISFAGKTLAYSGDTEWTDVLLDLARDADLFLCECYMYRRKVRFHMSYPELKENLPRLNCRRLLLTHPFREMLDYIEEVPEEFVHDSMHIEV